MTLFNKYTQTKLISNFSVDFNVAFVSKGLVTLSYCCVDHNVGTSECGHLVYTNLVTTSESTES